MPLPQKKLIPGLLLALVVAAFAAPPLWWSEGNPPVLNANPANNKGPANIGQAKHMAKSALDALYPILPGTAAAIEADLVGPGKPIPSWAAPANQTEKDKNHAPLLIGQLKAIAHPFYHHLNIDHSEWVLTQIQRNHDNSAIVGTHYWQVTGNPGYTENGYFPWNPVTSLELNKTIANIGQLKAVFSLRFEKIFDSDGDGIPNDWEIAHGINPNDPSDASSLFPGSQLTYLQAYQQGVQANPSATPGDKDGDGLADLNDADPDEMLVDWTRAEECGYVVIDLGLPPLELLYNSARPLLGIVLNNSDALAKEPNPDGNAPYYWGAETNFQWHEMNPYVRQGEPEPYAGWDSSVMFGDDGKIQLQGWLTGVGGPSGYWDMIVWTDHAAEPLVFNGPEDVTKELRYTTLSRFDRTVTENQTTEYPTYPDTAIPLTRTTTIRGNTTIQTADYSVSNTLWEVFRSHQRSSAAPILRSGKILERQLSTMHYRIGNIPLSFEPFSTLEDPHGNPMVSTIGNNDPNWEPLKVYRHRNSAWEKTPLPLMYDMNESGVGISHPGSFIWKNGRQIQLDDMLQSSGWENIQLEQINRNGTLLGSASRTGGNGDIVPVLLKELHVRDNTDATGVDNVSMTVETNDPGYQQDIWIMAPLQGPEPFDYENRAKFKVGGENTPSMGTGTLSAANATPVPNQLTVNGSFQDIDWRGTGDGIDSEEPVHLQLGSSINGNLPIRVKAMKNRKVKLKVYKSVRKKADGTLVQMDQNLVPSKEELEEYLNPLFAYQLNAWFEVKFADDTEEVEWGEDFTYTGTATEHSDDQKAAIAAHCGQDGLDMDKYDMHLFLLGHDDLLVRDDQGNSAKAVATPVLNTAWLLAMPVMQSTQVVLETIGHEVGHIFFGAGHPDELLLVDSGPAPLRGTDHTKRLMYSANKKDSRLIVKKEWDKAEEWLKLRPRGDQ